MELVSATKQGSQSAGHFLLGFCFPLGFFLLLLLRLLLLFLLLVLLTSDLFKPIDEEGSQGVAVSHLGDQLGDVLRATLLELLGQDLGQLIRIDIGLLRNGLEGSLAVVIHDQEVQLGGEIHGKLAVFQGGAPNKFQAGDLATKGGEAGFHLLPGEVEVLEAANWFRRKKIRVGLTTKNPREKEEKRNPPEAKNDVILKHMDTPAQGLHFSKFLRQTIEMNALFMRSVPEGLDAHVGDQIFAENNEEFEGMFAVALNQGALSQLVQGEAKDELANGLVFGLSGGDGALPLGKAVLDLLNVVVLLQGIEHNEFRIPKGPWLVEGPAKVEQVHDNITPQGERRNTNISIPLQLLGFDRVVGTKHNGQETRIDIVHKRDVPFIGKCERGRLRTC